MVISLGIEGTAHTFGVGIVDDSGKIFANIKSVYVPKVGGIHPWEAAKHHIKVCDKVISEALKTSNISIKDIDIIAFSQGPGLGFPLKGLV